MTAGKRNTAYLGHSSAQSDFLDGIAAFYIACSNFAEEA